MISDDTSCESQKKIEEAQQIWTKLTKDCNPSKKTTPKEKTKQKHKLLAAQSLLGQAQMANSDEINTKKDEYIKSQFRILFSNIVGKQNDFKLNLRIYLQI